ncbi:Asp-tRNA(Asn)/Glu-tRNA(Gln) amidotransferase subunit GatB [Desulfobotulus sp. H1]|uniref:Aspartyl/glutamyl-tRNA(Asn/Gln) amidotransferase subunit B n=1 Tax=Desulfobotulus pelophilus TaxID=2823377 RepID=A0ABT3NAX1_9BACT|nr:Asp-tRNA(Asn)/Glu-tRNA(Gln) amidotransferase subunit GatB [Desulfobotulus pelophilus]MCW7754614.1 Asp-tRNA(Asn)/Glu-tRNA(Gln) amidotransferase subunit GatB [Desulfobotulus pelophilus]
MDFEPVIGLEVHVQLKTASKIFCNCSTAFGAAPNAHTCPVCLALPGSLPVLNRKAAELAVKAVLATHCTLNRESRFDRKNYFYPDLPKAYQISQFTMPIGEHGWLEIEMEGRPEKKRIGITRIHMEEDAGKSSHDPFRPASLVDLNRAGTPLIEVVSEPDLSSPAEAVAYLRQLHAIVRYLDVCDGNMEEGSFRCDANVSLRPKGETKLGTRTELKNLNSFRYIEKAISYEIKRQESILRSGGTITQETRLWDSVKNQSFAMRSKEEAHDYRYFPDPDLVPLVLDENWIQVIQKNLPELPEARKLRFINEMGLKPDDAATLTASRELADYFESCLTTSNNVRRCTSWVAVHLLGLLNAKGLSIDSTPISAEALGELLQLLEKGEINDKIAKEVLEEMAETQKTAQAIIHEKGLSQVSDTSELETMVLRVLEENPAEVEAYKGGKTKLMAFFMGKIMKASRGQANPKMVTELLQRMLQ